MLRSFLHRFSTCFFLPFIFFPSGIFCQNGCAFVIDEPFILSDANLQSLVGDLRQTRLLTKHKRKFIPAFVKKELDCLAGGEFKIANPRQRYQSDDLAGL